MALSIFIRTLTLYVTILVVIRLLGKREVGQLSAFDLVVAIMLAEMSVLTIENLDTPLYIGFVPIITLASAEMLLSYISLKSARFRGMVQGTPSILIAQGKVIEKEVRKNRYTVDDLLSQLREKDVSNIVDVEYAILENSGALSVFLKSNKRPLTPQDMSMVVPYEEMPVPVVLDGKIDYQCLDYLGKDSSWLQEELAKQGVDSAEDVLLASYANGELFIGLKEKNKK